MFHQFRFATLLVLSLCTVADSVVADDTPRHALLLADSSKNRIAVLDEQGRITWESEIGPLHDLHMLDNGNILFQKNWTHLVEINPDTNQVVWEYDCSKSPENAARAIEVHAFQRLDDGRTMIAESGSSRIIEVDVAGKIVAEVPLKVSRPHPHRDTRLVRKLKSGNYLVCHEGDGFVREYDATGETAWEYQVPLFGNQPANGHGVKAFGNQCFTALRLDSGNTLISTGNGHGVIEVTPNHQIVWQVMQDDLPGIQLAWVTTLQQLPNGNRVLGNCHAEATNPQIVEIQRDKKVVWTFKDFNRFGNSLTNTQVLTTNGQPIVAEPGRDR
ncbi:beta-propeller domain-containing protein [Aureliella helgolandensis]|nr:PQQ-binding-like beta-propeller repeat protein [Aureliella helgolandensis]